ncbi:MAG: nucleotidyltransferase family protein [Chloroflexota bacterium]
MVREEVLRVLRQHKQDLDALGVKSLAVFGSLARDEAQPDSDIDILVEFSGPATFDGFMETKFFLEDLLSRSVDLVTPQALRPRLRSQIEAEAIRVA